MLTATQPPLQKMHAKLAVVREGHASPASWNSKPSLATIVVLRAVRDGRVGPLGVTALHIQHGVRISQLSRVATGGAKCSVWQ
jgi:hypothetical protein